MVDEMKMDTFFNCNLQELITFNLNGIKDRDWSNIWAFACGMLWYWRNQGRYNDDHIMHTNLLNEIRMNFSTYKESVGLMQKVYQKKRTTHLISWTPLSDNWFALNTYGMIKCNLEAGCGGILRD